MYELHKYKIWSQKPLKAFLNVLGAAMSRRFRLKRPVSMPFVLYLEPTTFCNLRCPACPTGTGVLGRPKVRATAEQFVATVDALHEYVFLLVMYNWGEPLLHTDFSTMVRYATDRGMLVHASSNLSMRLTSGQCRELVSSGLHLLLVGVDGATPGAHALYRRGSNLSIVHENLRLISEAKRELKSATPLIVSEFLVFRHNEDEAETYAEQMQNLGVEHTLKAPLLPSGGALEPARNAKYDRYRRHFDALELLRAASTKLSPCTWLYYSTVVNPGGTISPCCMVTNQDSDFGAVRQNAGTGATLRDFVRCWTGDTYRKARGLFGYSAIATWARDNLKVHPPDGMGLAQAGQSNPLICSICPIPEDIHMWSGLIESIHGVFVSELRRCPVVRSPARWFGLCARTLLLRVTLFFDRGRWGVRARS